MIELTIGDIIREKRKALHLTQEEVCFGICDKVTMSRIETDKQTPSRTTLNALLQRLDISDDRFFAAVSVEEVQINELCNEITALNVQYEKAGREEKKTIKEDIEEKQQKLRALMSKNDKLTEQFLVRSEVIIGGYKSTEKIDKLIKALRLTHPDFDISKIKNGIFSVDEIKMINQIAMAFSEQNDSEKALRIWEDLLTNNKDRYEKIVPAKTQRCLILYGLSREYLIRENIKKAMMYAEEGREIAIDYGIYRHLPGFLIILAECMHQLDDDAKSKELFEDVYHLCKVINDKANQKIAIEAMKEYFSIVHTPKL
ncbi:Helix-turn-helix domain-containing protein [Butyrivibrio sp. INlla18]|uniref:helix-turn-helix domain-containing protein n=1 Tax=Butyrivibrio sp. INlla18 TaxID=1520806 RepID=UPI0008876C98|nr:helix-turn-helix transcriptional regulator [Butyrivibrio sp. INlla18]SDA54757.1 Helix-turn-helix domain-containing protein [Butyrivibrio sp. INlla18]